MAENATYVDVWLPAQTATSLFGSNRANSSLPLPTGGTFWVPGDPEQHQLYGTKFKADGTPTQLQHMAHTLLQQCLSCVAQHQAGAVDYSPGAVQWWFLGAGSTQMGPFSGSHLQQFLSSGVCQRDQLVCHGPAAVWLPLWLVLLLVGLQAPPPQQAPAPQQHSPVPTPSEPQHSSHSSITAQQHQQQDNQQQQQPPPPSPAAAAASSSSAPGHSRSSKAGVNHDSDPDDYGYGPGPQVRAPSSAWLKKVQALEAATKAKQQQEKQQQGQQQRPHEPRQSGATHGQQQGVSRPDGAVEHHDADAEMMDVSAEAVLQAVSQLRGDQEYLDELCRAVAMDIDLPQDYAQPVAAAGTCNAVDLATVAAGAAAHAASSSWLQQDRVQLVVVLDTNVLLEGKLVRALQRLQQMQQQQRGGIMVQLPQQQHQGAPDGQPAAAAVCVQVVVPWTVLVELDRLKTRSGAVAEHSRWAVEELRRELVKSTDTHTAGGQGGSSIFTVQSLQGFRQAAHDCDFGVPASALVGDDRILQCALSKQHRLRKQEGQQQPRPNGQGTTCCGVLLLSNDKVLQLKAKANGMAVAGLVDLPPVDATPALPAAASIAQGTASTSAGQTLQQMPAYVIRMLQLSGVNPPWLRLALTAAGSSMQHGASAHQHTRPSGGAAGSTQQASQARASSSLPIYGGLPQRSAQSPTQASEASPKPAAYTQQHMRHVQGLQEQHPHQQQQQQHNISKHREAAVSFLTFLRLSLADTVLGWFQAELGEFWENVLQHKPPWSDQQFVQVMNHHWNSTVKGHLVALDRHRAGHIKSNVEHLKEMSRQLHSRHFKGDNAAQLPMQVGVRVVEVLNAFGSTQAAQQVEDVLTAAAPGTTPDAGSLVRALLDGRPATSAAAAPGAQAAAAVTTVQSASAPQGLGQPSAVPHMQASHVQHHPQVSVGASSPQDSASAALAGTIAAAAAAVAAPQPEGPCLTLGQLLLYAVTLLQAVLPLLGQVLAGAAVGAAGHGGQSGGSAAAAGVAVAMQWAVAVEQQLRSTVQHLERLGQHISQQQQQGLHEETLQTGMRLVELCSALLNDESARSAVSQQLLLHANGFVAQAVGYLTGGKQQGAHAAGPAVILQQLTAALQHLQHLLMQAMQQG